jgi:hypothetical protein
MRLTTIQAWRRVASKLVGRLAADKSNGLMLADPWSRAAHSMVQGWQIRLSRPPLKNNVRMTTRPTWEVFARLAVGILASKAWQARKSEWRLWASRRVSGGCRYTPKRDRRW